MSKQAKPTVSTAKGAKGNTGKLAARFKQYERPIFCVRVPEHKAIHVDYRPEVGKPIKALGCETCGIVWRFTQFRYQGPYIILAEGMGLPSRRV